MEWSKPKANNNPWGGGKCQIVIGGYLQLDDGFN